MCALVYPCKIQKSRNKSTIKIHYFNKKKKKTIRYNTDQIIITVILLINFLIKHLNNTY